MMMEFLDSALWSCLYWCMLLCWLLFPLRSWESVVVVKSLAESAVAGDKNGIEMHVEERLQGCRSKLRVGLAPRGRVPREWRLQQDRE